MRRENKLYSDLVIYSNKIVSSPPHLCSYEECGIPSQEDQVAIATPVV